MVHSDPESQREDLLQLLALIEDPRDMAGELCNTERKWLQAAEQQLNLSGLSLLDFGAMRRAVLAYRLLSRTPRTAAGASDVDDVP